MNYFKTCKLVMGSMLLFAVSGAHAQTNTEIKDFFIFVKQCFKQRRKTIYNNLKETMDGESALAMLERAGIEPARRAQELTTEQLKALYEAGK